MRNDGMLFVEKIRLKASLLLRRVYYLVRESRQLCYVKGLANRL